MRRQRVLQFWARPLDESALPLLGQMAGHAPDAVAALPWLEPWPPKLSSLSAAHQRINEHNRVMRAANLWLRAWSPAMLMLGSPRYWSCWVDDHVAPHPGIVRLRSSAPLMTGAVHCQHDTAQRDQGMRLRVLEALCQRGALDVTLAGSCPTQDTEHPVPLGLALVDNIVPSPWRGALTLPAETRRLEFLGRYTQLLARRAQPEAPANSTRQATRWSTPSRPRMPNAPRHASRRWWPTSGWT